MTSIHFDFSGKTVLVTGASRGIGFGVARGFAQAGAELHILATNDTVITAAKTLGRETGATVYGHVCDITDRARVSAVMKEFGHIDVLINNAGLERPTPILQADEVVDETFQRIIDTNIMGGFHITREALPHMGTGGKIVMTSSIWGQTAVPEMSAYCASKHANIGFMRSLAQELGPKGINVNAVCPGWVRTDAAMKSLGHMARISGRGEDELLAEITAAQALPGLMEPDDMIGAYLFLCSDAAKNITGQTLNVDRGEVMG